MPLDLTWQQIAIRIGLASISSLIIGINRDERGHPAGVRTTMLVCLAATLAMLQANLLLPLAGKLPSSFVVMDLMRLPLGILSGIGFIGAGVIVKRNGDISGVTTAATLWMVTVLGLLFGGGNLYLGVAGSVAAMVILWIIKVAEKRLPHDYHGTLSMCFSPDGPSEVQLRQRLTANHLKIVHWNPRYEPSSILTALECEVKWRGSAMRLPDTPQCIEEIRSLYGITSLSWKE
jgi:putative Mg2+ transporter-C (MgtC) family protein